MIKKRSKASNTGRCLLTGRMGKMAKSHILPRAFTKPEKNGERFLQIESGDRVKYRRDSWYDYNIVTTSGEKILSDLDNFGAKFLLENRLVWSSIFPLGKSISIAGTLTGHPDGTITVFVSNPSKLRRFWASVLWRVGVSKLDDMKYVRVPEKDLERLRQEVVGEREADPYFYPLSLMHHCTVGPRHNHTPITRFFEDPSPFDVSLRITFDGITAICYPDMDEKHLEVKSRSAIVGTGSSILVHSLPFKGSWAERNMLDAIKETAINWPRLL